MRFSPFCLDPVQLLSLFSPSFWKCEVLPKDLQSVHLWCLAVVMEFHATCSEKLAWILGNLNSVFLAFFLSATRVFFFKDTCVSCCPSYKMLQEKHHLKLHFFALKYRILPCFTDCDLLSEQIMPFFHSFVLNFVFKAASKVLSLFTLFLRFLFCSSGDQNHTSEFPLVMKKKETKQNKKKKQEKNRKATSTFHLSKHKKKLYSSRPISNLFSLAFHSVIKMSKIFLSPQ